jgi:hypothetical protein
MTTQRASLKSLVGAGVAAEQPRPAHQSAELETAPPRRAAQTRENTRQVSGHYKPEVAQALRMLAAEQDREQQDLLAEALNMLFERYGKITRAVPLGTRRKRASDDQR